MHLSETEWSLIKRYIPISTNDPRKGGRPRQDARQVLEGIMWVLKTGARWRDMPKSKGVPSYQTCHRTFQSWRNAGLFSVILENLSWELSDKGKLFLQECFVDATFSSAKKGA